MPTNLEAILELGSVTAVEIAASALAERGTKTGNCANCAKPLLGADCAVCGQPTNRRQRSVRDLVHDFFVDHLTFSLSINTFAFVALIAAAGLTPLISGEAAAWLMFALLSPYIFVAMKRCYEQGWFMTSVKFVMISGIYTVFFLLPAVAAVLAVNFFFGDKFG